MKKARWLLLGVLVLTASTAARADQMADAAFAYQVGDFGRAEHLYRVVAATGNPHAQMALGFLYHDGQGLPQDYLRAYMWFMIAATGFDMASRDFADASEALDITAQSLTPAEIERAEDMAKTCIERNFRNCD